jgi:hypothetical protein
VEGSRGKGGRGKGEGGRGEREVGIVERKGEERLEWKKREGRRKSR